VFKELWPRSQANFLKNTTAPVSDCDILRSHSIVRVKSRKWRWGKPNPQCRIERGGCSVEDDGITASQGPVANPSCSLEAPGAAGAGGRTI